MRLLNGFKSPPPPLPASRTESKYPILTTNFFRMIILPYLTLPYINFVNIYSRLKDLIKVYGGQEALPKKKKGGDSESGARNTIGREVYVSRLIEAMRRDPVIENDYEKLAKTLQSVANDGAVKKGFGNK